jgi:integrase
MRKNEILMLTRERVDFTAACSSFAETKNGRPREVPMNRAVCDELSSLPGPKEEGLTFRRRATARPGATSGPPSSTAYTRAEITDFRFHDLRHTCTSSLIMRGRSLREVQEISAIASSA